MKNIMLSAITSIAKNLSPVLRFLHQRESVRATMSRVLILLMLAQPMLAHAAPFVHSAEATAQQGVAKLRSWMPKTVETKAAEAPKPVMEKAIGIDEWMAQKNSTNESLAVHAPISNLLTTPAFATLSSTKLYVNYGPLGAASPSLGEINPVLGTVTNVFTSTTVPNSAALGMHTGGTTPTLYYADRTTIPNQLRRYDGTTESASLGTFPGSDNATIPVLRMSFRSSDNLGYTISNNNTYYSFTPTSPSVITSLGVVAFQGVSPTSTTSSGDIAFDGFGRAWAIFGNSLYRMDFNVAPIKAYPIGQITVGGVGLPVVDTGGNGNIVGAIAFDSAGDLYIAGNYVVANVTQYNRIFKISVNDATAVQVGSNLTTFSSPDLASGNYPMIAPDIVATKSVSPTGNVKPGDTLTYTVEIQNNGTAPAVVLTFSDALPTGTTYVASSATLNGTNLAAAAYPFTTPYTISGRTASSGAIKAGNANRATVTYQVKVNTTSTPVSVVNTAVINYLDAPSGGITSNSTTNTVVSPVDGYKSVQLTTDADSSGTITEGDTVTWTVSYKNTTTAAITSVQMNDTLPTGVSIAATGGQTVTVSGTGTAATKNTLYTGAAAGALSNLLATSATLGASGTISVSIPVTINSGFTGDISNQATATGSSIPTAGTLTDNVDSTTTGLPAGITVPAGSVVQTATTAIDPTTLTVVPPTPNLRLTKSAPSQAQAGAATTYTMTVGNVGRVTTSGTITVVDALPTGVSVNGGASGSLTLSGAQGANWTCNSDGSSPQTITCVSTATIAASSGTSVFSFNVNVGATVMTNVINLAKVFGGNDPNKPIATTTGAISACTLASENLAGGVANAGCAYESTPVATVQAFKSVKLTTDADTSGTITPGDTLTYKISYVNTGVAAATTFQINDQLPAGLTISATGGQTVTVTGTGTAATKNATYTGAASGAASDLLAASATLGIAGVINVTIPVTVAAAAIGTKSNQASGMGTGLPSPVLTDNVTATTDFPAVLQGAPYSLTTTAGSVTQTLTGTVDPTTLTIVPAPSNLKLTKATATSAQAGGSLTYTMTVTNNGVGVTSATTTVTDALPTGVTVNSGAAGVLTLSGAQAANWTCNSDALSPQTITCTSTTAIAATTGTSVFAFIANVDNTVTANMVNLAKVWGGGDPNKPALTTTGAISACTLASENTAGSTANAGCAYESTPVVNVTGYKSVKLTTDTDSSGTITAGDTLTWIVQYANTGSGSTTNFQINDALPSGLTIASTGGQTVTVSGSGTAATKNTAYTGAAAGVGGDLLAASATLAAGGVITVTVPVTVDAGATGTKSNQASATATGLASAVLTDNAGAVTDLPALVTAVPYLLTVPVGSVAQTIAATVDPTTVTISAALPDLKLLKVAPLSVQAGTALTYTMTVANVGLGATSGTISVVDELPLGVTVNGGVSGSVTLSGLQAANWTCNSNALSPQTITCTSTTSMVASSGVSIFAFSADVATTVTNNLINQAKVFGGGDPNKTAATTTGAITDCLAASENLAGSVINTGCAFESTPVINVAGFKSVKLTTDADSSSSITPGDTLTYTLQYTNTGTADATVFQLNDVLPTGLTKSGPLTITILLGSSVAVTNPLYTGAAAGAVSNLLLAGGILKAGGVITLNIPVTVNSGFSGTLSNQATATALELSPAGVKTDNAGATADLPATVTAAPYSLTIPTGSVAQTITAAIDPVTVTVGVSTPTVAGYKSVKLTTDADSSGSITAGDTLTWTVQYANTGTVDVPAFQIADQLPSGITITAAGAQTVTVTGAGTSATKDAIYTGNSLATSMALTAGATLAQQGTITLTIPVTINAGFTGTLSNQASGSGTGMPAAVSTDNAGVTADLPATVTAAPYSLTIPNGSVTQTITAAIDPTLAVVVAAPTVAAYKSVKLTTDADSSGDVTAGDTLTWTVQYANTGTVDVTGFQLNDTLPVGLTITGTGNQTLTITGSTTAAKNTNYTGATAGAVSDLLTAAVTFKAGDILKLEIPVTVNAGATGTLLNQALGTATNLPVAGVRTDNVDSVTSGLLSGVTVPTGSLTQTQNPPTDPTAVTIATTPTVLAFKSVKLTTDVNSNSLPDPGDTLIWSVWYKNTGTIDVTTFQISDALPAGVTITGAGNQTVTITGTTTAAKSTTYTGAAAGAVSDLLTAAVTFKAGDLIQIDIPVTVNAGFAGSLLNQATGTGGNLPLAGVLTDNADNVTPSLPSGVTIPTGSAVQTLTPATDPTSLTVAGVPLMTLVKSVTPIGDQQPGTDLTYQIVFTNTGNASAQDIVIFDPIPNDTDFKLGSATMTLGTTGLTMVAEYSNDFVAATPATATWTYTPVTAGGGADTGYDRNVKAVRWRVSAGTLSQTSPNHTGDVGFIVKIR